MLAWSTGNTIGVVAIAVAICALVVPVVVSSQHGKAARADRTADRAQDARDRDAAAAAERRAALDAADPRFSAEAQPIAQGTVLRDEGRSPIDLSVEGDAVWVHAVALVWRYSADADWRGPAGTCTPLYGVVLPRQWSPGSAMGLSWSADQPPEVGSIRWQLHVSWGLGSDGDTRMTEVVGGSTNWQYG